MTRSLPITNSGTKHDYISCSQKFIDMLLVCCFEFSALLGENGLNKDDCENGRTNQIAKLRYVYVLLRVYELINLFYSRFAVALSEIRRNRQSGIIPQLGHLKKLFVPRHNFYEAFLDEASDLKRPSDAVPIAEPLVQNGDTVEYDSDTDTTLWCAKFCSDVKFMQASRKQFEYEYLEYGNVKRAVPDLSAHYLIVPGKHLLIFLAAYLSKRCHFTLIGIGYLCPFCPAQAVFRCVKKDDIIKHIRIFHIGTTILISPTVAIEVGLCLCDLCRYAFSAHLFGAICPICPHVLQFEDETDQKVGQSNAIEIELSASQEVHVDSIEVNDSALISPTVVMAPEADSLEDQLPTALAVRYLYHYCLHFTAALL